MVVPHDAPRREHLVIYLLISAATLGVSGYGSAANMLGDQPNTDIWQHVAAIRALMDNLGSPQNPFVVSQEPSRHFQPLWVATAALGRALDLTVWQAVAIATYANMIVLMLAVYAFARVFFTSPWAPSVLLAVMLLAWRDPLQHTGMHNMLSLYYAAAYPATLMIALSLLLWAAVIKALEDRRYLPALVALAPVMMMTHQLGAVIGFMGAFAFAVTQPGATYMRRLVVLLAIAGGLPLALLWPYFNVLEITLRGGSSSWESGMDFYASPWVPQILIPAYLGVFWLWRRQAWGLALALLLFTSAYLLGLLGIHVLSRFLMPIVLILHIALAGLVLEASGWLRPSRPSVRRAVRWLAVVFVLFEAAKATAFSQGRFAVKYAEAPDVYAVAEQMALDIPDDEPIAALSLTVWPIVATGQRAYSVPWPEPGISDLAQRQEINAALFDVALTPDERRALAREIGVRVLMADLRLMPEGLLAALTESAVSTAQESTLHRFDLWD